MLNISDRVFVSLKIDGQELPYANLLNITLAEGNGALIPAFQIDLTDPTSLLASSNVLTEGNTVDVLVSRSHTDTQAIHRKYRIFSPKRENNTFNPTLSIVGILNSPLYITASKIESYRGSSDTALKQLAQRCGLRYSGPSDFNGKTMADQQAWLNVCKNRASFAQDVAKHGWADDNSGMSLTLTSLGEMRYRNLIDVINTPASKIKFVFYHSAMTSSDDSGRKGYVVRQVNDRSVAGVMSSWLNYGNTRVQNSLEGESVVVDKLAVKLPGPYLPINSSVSDTVGRARVDYAPIDCGNVHEKYQNAFYQNMRIRALFSERLSLLVNDVTEVELYDPVIYRQADADVASPIKNSDIYIVIGKTVAVRGGIHYAERIELARMSLTMKGNTDLKKPGSFASERSLIPDVKIDQSVIGSIAKEGMSAARAVTTHLNDLSNVSEALSALPSKVSEAVDTAFATASKLLKDVRTGLVDLPVLDDMANAAETVFNTVSDVEGIVRLAQSTADDALSAIQNMPYTMRNAVISRAGSIVDNLATQLGISGPLNRTIQFTNEVLDRLPLSVQTLPAVSKARYFASSSTNMIEHRIMQSVSDQWNKAVGNLKGIAVPLQSGMNTAASAARLYNEMQNMASSTQFKLATQTELAKDVARSGNWLSAKSLVLNTMDTVDDLERTSRNLNSSLKRWG